METEIKIIIQDVGAFCERVLSCGAARLSEREFEDNHLLDFPDERLQKQHCLLRVRFVGGRGVLTYKGAPEPNGLFKSREELETGVEDPALALQMLKLIGMCLRFRYQKYRQEFALDGARIAVDETPIGNFAEIEGTENEILSVARKLDIKESQFMRQSYYTLYAEDCRKKGISQEFMVFKPVE